MTIGLEGFWKEVDLISGLEEFWKDTDLISGFTGFDTGGFTNSSDGFCGKKFSLSPINNLKMFTGRISSESNRVYDDKYVGYNMKRPYGLVQLIRYLQIAHPKYLQEHTYGNPMTDFLASTQRSLYREQGEDRGED